MTFYFKVAINFIIERAFFKFSLLTHDIMVRIANITINTISITLLNLSANTTLRLANSPRKKTKTFDGLSNAEMVIIVITMEVYELK